MAPPAVLKLDLSKPALAPAPPPGPRGLAYKGPPPARPATKPNVPGRLVVSQKDQAAEDDGTADSWWTARATSKVEPGFSRDVILAEAPFNPASPGGLFERLGQVLTQLSETLIAG